MSENVDWKGRWECSPLTKQCYSWSGLERPWITRALYSKTDSSIWKGLLKFLPYRLRPCQEDLRSLYPHRKAQIILRSIRSYRGSVLGRERNAHVGGGVVSTVTNVWPRSPGRRRYGKRGEHVDPHLEMYSQLAAGELSWFDKRVEYTFYSLILFAHRCKWTVLASWNYIFSAFSEF